MIFSPRQKSCHAVRAMEARGRNDEVEHVTAVGCYKWRALRYSLRIDTEIWWHDGILQGTD